MCQQPSVLRALAKLRGRDPEQTDPKQMAMMLMKRFDAGRTTFLDYTEVRIDYAEVLLCQRVLRGLTCAVSRWAGGIYESRARVTCGGAVLRISRPRQGEGCTCCVESSIVRGGGTHTWRSRTSIAQDCATGRSWCNRARRSCVGVGTPFGRILVRTNVQEPSACDAVSLDMC